MRLVEAGRLPASAQALMNAKGVTMTVYSHPALSGLVGIGLKPEHAEDILAGPRHADFFEIHAENYLGAGGPPHHLLRLIRADYPLSIHGVGLSIGGVTPLDRVHLVRLKRLI